MANILIVDDHELTRKTLKRRLSKADHVVMEAGNAIGGIQILEENEIHLILMDFMMKNMNGMQTFEKMKEIKPDVPCAMLTAYAHAGLIKQFMTQGGVDFMVKPIGEDFEERVEKILNPDEAPDPAAAP